LKAGWQATPTGFFYVWLNWMPAELARAALEAKP
jgi:hypothetical protein